MEAQGRWGPRGAADRVPGDPGMEAQRGWGPRGAADGVPGDPGMEAQRGWGPRGAADGGLRGTEAGGSRRGPWGPGDGGSGGHGLRVSGRTGPPMHAEKSH